MHYWRAPVPEMWIDILEKVKAAGYVHNLSQIINMATNALLALIQSVSMEVGVSNLLKNPALIY